VEACASTSSVNSSEVSGVHRLVHPPRPGATTRRGSHDQRVPHRAGPRRGQGRHDEPTAVGDPVRSPAARPARSDHRGTGSRGVGGHPAHPRPGSPLMPPAARCPRCLPTTRTWKTRPAQPDLAGLRDRALLLWGSSPRCAAASSPRSPSTNSPNIPTDPCWPCLAPRPTSTDSTPELVVLPRVGRPTRCHITNGPVLRPISKGNRALPRHLHPESINDLVQAAVYRVDPDATGYSAHSIRSLIPAAARAPGRSHARRSPTRVGRRSRYHDGDLGPPVVGHVQMGGLPRSLERLSPLPKPESPPALGVHPSIYSNRCSCASPSLIRQAQSGRPLVRSAVWQLVR
jgi:hypothetical protein